MEKIIRNLQVLSKMINTSLAYPLFFSLLPVFSYGFRYFTLSMVLLLLTLLKGKLYRTDLLILFSIFLFSALVDLAYSQSSLTLNSTRWVILILFARFLKLHSLYPFILFLLLVNFAIINPFWIINLDFLHAKSVADLYGRESGLFFSPPILGYIGSLGILVFLHRLLSSDMKIFWNLLFNLFFFIVSLYMIMSSQNKTFILLSSVFSFLLILRYIGIRSIVLLCIIALAAPFIYNLFKYDFYFLVKLSSILETGNSSSLNARFEIWGQFIELWLSTLPFFVFGVPKEIQYLVGNTFDNDYLFFIVNYGIFGVLFLLFGIVYILKLMWHNRFSIESFCVGLGMAAALFVGIVSSPQSDILFLVSVFSLVSIVGKNYGS